MTLEEICNNAAKALDKVYGEDHHEVRIMAGTGFIKVIGLQDTMLQVLAHSSDHLSGQGGISLIFSTTNFHPFIFNKVSTRLTGQGIQDSGSTRAYDVDGSIENFKVIFTALHNETEISTPVAQVAGLTCAK